LIYAINTLYYNKIIYNNKEMNKINLLIQTSKAILNIQKEWPILVWINWIDGSWKTYFTKELSKELEKSWRNIISISVDDFHNPLETRYQKWRNSPEWFYLDSYNYEWLIEHLLLPFSKWKWKYLKKIFDLKHNTPIQENHNTVGKNDILLFEWIFIFRPELIKYWDLKLFINVDFEVSLERNIKREKDLLHIGSEEKIREKYNIRYMPWQKLYFKDATPKVNADIVIDNNDYNNPKITII